MSFSRENGQFTGTAQANGQQIPFSSSAIPNPPSMEMGPMQNAVMQNDGTISMSEPATPSMQSPAGVTAAGMATGMANTNEEPTMGKTDKDSTKSSSSSSKKNTSKSDKDKKKKNGTAQISIFAGILGATLCAMLA